MVDRRICNTSHPSGLLSTISKFCCFNNLSMKNQFFQNTKSKNQNFVFPPKPSESTLLCRHFAPLIVRIGSRSSENGPFEVWKCAIAWISRFFPFFTKEGKKTRNPCNVTFSNFKWTVLRAPWTDSNDQGRKMTAFERTFRKTKRKKLWSKFDFRILEKTDFYWTVGEESKSMDCRFGWP